MLSSFVHSLHSHASIYLFHSPIENPREALRNIFTRATVNAAAAAMSQPNAGAGAAVAAGASSLLAPSNLMSFTGEQQDQASTFDVSAPSTSAFATADPTPFDFPAPSTSQQM